MCEYPRTWNVNSLAVRWMMFQVRMVYHTWKSGTPTERSVLRHKPEIISHKKLRHILAGEEAVTDLGGGDVHYGSVYDLYVV